MLVSKMILEEVKYTALFSIVSMDVQHFQQKDQYILIVELYLVFP